MTEQELREIELRCAGATPGPWISYVEGRDHLSGDNFIMTAGEDIYLSGASVPDQDFIATARQDIPRLIAEIRLLRAALDQRRSGLLHGDEKWRC